MGKGRNAWVVARNDIEKDTVNESSGFVDPRDPDILKRYQGSPHFLSEPGEG